MKITPEIQNAIIALVRVLWEAYGKEKALELMEALMTFFKENEWLGQVADALLEGKIEWKDYIIEDDICTPGGVQ